MNGNAGNYSGSKLIKVPRAATANHNVQAAIWGIILMLAVVSSVELSAEWWWNWEFVCAASLLDSVPVTGPQISAIKILGELLLQ